MAVWHKPYRSYWNRNSTVHLTSSRDLCSCSLTRARNKFRGLRQRFRRALGTGRADGKLKPSLLPRARFKIQTDMQTELRDRKSVWAKHGVGAGRRIFHVKQPVENLHIVTLPCATGSLHVSAFRTETARGWLHVPARPICNRQKRAGMRSRFSMRNNASDADSFSKKYNRKSRAAHHSETHRTPPAPSRS